MASPEQLSQRVGGAEQDITATSDTVLDIKETVDGHTETLTEHGRKLDEITGRLDTLETRVSQGFAEILTSSQRPCRRHTARDSEGSSAGRISRSSFVRWRMARVWSSPAIATLSVQTRPMRT